MDRLRAEIRLDALDLAGHQFDGFLPAHPHPLVGAAQLGLGARAVLQPALAYHGILDAVLGVHLERRHVDKIVRRRIIGYRLDAHHATIFDDRLESTPVGAGQNALLGGHQSRELTQCGADGLRQRTLGKNAAEQGQGCAGAESLEQVAAGQIGLVVIEKSHNGFPLCQP